MRIGELARRTGVTPSTLRFYEEQDMFSPGQVLRTPNGYRDYTEGARQRVALILAGRGAGFSLLDMRTQMRDWPTMTDAEREQILRAQLAVLDQRAAEIDRSRAEIREVLGIFSARRAEA
ncbi:MerR family transcriptional regulator [Brachybacterium ginsengisoli]|nr:MerR family transcriptional regulator [Brachybacterium ginsengisoli]